MSLNNMVILIGYVGQHIQAKTTSKGSKMVLLRLATHEPGNKKSETNTWLTTWHNVIAWDKTAEHAEQSLVKGSRVLIKGRICYSKYVDRQDHTRYLTEIKAEYIQNLDR
ncbi:MAG: single-stranded DNA-binding protein [Chitinophagaceae bacterium]